MNIIDINDLRTQQVAHKENILDTLETVELNVTEICNRTCVFCPRGHPEVYSNTKRVASLNLISTLSKQLQKINFSKRISITGYGEPLLYKNLVDAISIIRDHLPNLKWLEINTNGDFLSNKIIQNLANAGCTNLSVSMYDSDISKKISKMVEGIDIVVSFKNCYETKFELKLVNRINIIKKENILNVDKPCNLPFYKTFVDYNGDVLVCANDWGRQGKIGNILLQPIDEIWVGDNMKKYRTALANSRKNITPCNFCDINGELLGSTNVNTFKKYYA